jgi:hypothetical protein
MGTVKPVNPHVTCCVTCDHHWRTSTETYHCFGRPDLAFRSANRSKWVKHVVLAEIPHLQSAILAYTCKQGRAVRAPLGIKYLIVQVQTLRITKTLVPGSLRWLLLRANSRACMTNLLNR